MSRCSQTGPQKFSVSAESTVDFDVLPCDHQRILAKMRDQEGTLFGLKQPTLSRGALPQNTPQLSKASAIFESPPSPDLSTSSCVLLTQSRPFDPLVFRVWSSFSHDPNSLTFYFQVLASVQVTGSPCFPFKPTRFPWGFAGFPSQPTHPTPSTCPAR